MLDMLEVGVKLTELESRVHFAMWSIISSPLILGFDLSDTKTMDAVWHIIANEEVLAVNQQWAGRCGTSSGDHWMLLVSFPPPPFSFLFFSSVNLFPAGHPGRLVQNASTYFVATCEHGCTGGRKENCSLPEWQVWAKPMPGGAEAVLIVNVADVPSATITVTLASLNISGPVTIRDLWTHTNNGTAQSEISAQELPPHGGMLVLLTPQ
jgi:hypothetical protein